MNISNQMQKYKCSGVFFHTIKNIKPNCEKDFQKNNIIFDAITCVLSDF